VSETRSPCLISDKRACRASDQKNMVFIIGSGSSEFKEDVEEIVRTLGGFGLEGYFALLSEEEKGLDAFCDKICSKIIEAQFCVVMRGHDNDPVQVKRIEGTADRYEKVRVPSANVYYEFGLAVALGKNFIPVIKGGFKPPFDVQHLDAVYYESAEDLPQRLKSPIVATLKKKGKQAAPVNEELVKSVYGPLYDETAIFLSRRDKFSRFEPNQYYTTLVQNRYLLDTIDSDLLKDIASFYGTLEEFNNAVTAADGIIRQIVIEEISDLSGMQASDLLSISVGLQTDTAHILPTLDQILMRKTTPELYLQTTGTSGTIKKITYKLRMPDHSDKEIDSDLFGLLHRKCERKVESNPRIARMRELEADLELKGKELQAKLKQYFR
jgi:hypothetical protein